MSLDNALPDGRRAEFGAFLRSRRERLRPDAVGLPDGFRRRTPGLRREEVALLAGVGTTWYTWLEQGRDVSASPEVLAALAEALRLSPVEREHLFVLAGKAAPRPRNSGPERVDEPLRRMVTSLRGHAALVVGRRWDVLCWNESAAALFGDYGKLEGDARNLMHMLFANAAHRQLLVDWDKLAPISLAMFRADNARYAGDPDFDRLIATLMAASPEFRMWWPRHEVLPPLAGHKRIRHPVAGAMSFEFTALAVVGNPDMKLIVYTPLEEDDSIRKMEALLKPLRS
jgi:transcriptional regulator with XRE-family HTH domain